MQYDAGVAAMEGRFADSERLTREAFSVGQRARHPMAQGCYDIQRVIVARERGEPEVAVDAFGPLVERGWGRGGVPIHWLAATVARAHFALGARDAALALWRKLAEPGFAAVPRNIRWTRSIAEIAHLCADLGERESSAELIALLEPVAHQHSAIPIPVTYGGPLRHALARLYLLAGKRAPAEEALLAAVVLYRIHG